MRLLPVWSLRSPAAGRMSRWTRSDHRPPLLVGRIIGLAEVGAALAAMDGLSEGAGMTVIQLL
jgi:hypothetical protein